MPVSVSEHLNVSQSEFEKTGAFDAILDTDSRFFIDPLLLKDTTVPEIKPASAHLVATLSNVMRLLKASQREGDALWNRAFKLLPSGELEGLCIGYAEGTGGSGIGPKLKRQMFRTVKEFINAGIEDPAIFELAAVFEKNVGSDRISDLMGKMTMKEIIAYTLKVLDQVGYSGPTRRHKFGSDIVNLPMNPFNKEPILLVPRDILRDLPLAQDWSDIDRVVAVNEEVRESFHKIIGHSWDAAKRVKKDEIKQLLIREPELVSDLLSKYHKKPASRYDFGADPSGRANWHKIAMRYANENPLELNKPEKLTAEAVNEIVIKIISHFKKLVEDKGLWKMLYHDGAPKGEDATQLLFYGVADAYCTANDLDISPETDAGRGEVDFKISQGAARKVVVETKLTSHTRLMHGYHTQVAEYAKAEDTDLMHYLVIDVEARGSEARLNRLLIELRKDEAVSSDRPKVSVVNARPKKPASKY